MNPAVKVTDKVLSKLRSLYLRINKKLPPQRVTMEMAEYRNQDASDHIREKLLSEKPCMIARLGEVELNFLTDYRTSRSGLSKYWRYITGEIEAYKIPEARYLFAQQNAGIFPANDETLFRFCETMLEDMKELDILGSWLHKERFFDSELKHATKVGLTDLDPWEHMHPYTMALSGRKVLVIHPFTDTIQSQYQKRQLLFQNEQILPEFELKTIKAVQTIAGVNTNKFRDWFGALEQMKSEINSADFDVAIIGCGAYGFSLAAHVKRIGKQSIHLGGATQILFGIKGKRWENRPQVAALMNQHWVRPSEEETPKSHSTVEGGCYW